MTNTKDTITGFALHFLRANIEDSEVGGVLAEKLGLVQDEEDFDPERDGEKLLKLIESVQDVKE